MGKINNQIPKDSYNQGPKEDVVQPIFKVIYSYLGRKGTGSSHRSKFGITYANQHGSKELHLGTIRDDLLKFRAMCKPE
ncbi:MAG: hypothetical protein K2L13_00470 [Opitutales bacterium]|nr:hypothetical protein [Opitutales bacterium]